MDLLSSSLERRFKTSDFFSTQLQYGIGNIDSYFAFFISKKLPSPCSDKSSENKLINSEYKFSSFLIVIVNVDFKESIQACESSRITWSTFIDLLSRPNIVFPLKTLAKF